MDVNFSNNEKPASVFASAKYLAQYSNWSISNLTIQKLLYIANMLFLVEHKKPLLDHCFEAWMYGPVIPVLYHKLKIFGADPVGNIFRQYKDLEQDNHKSVISMTYNILSNASASQLVALTHREESGWAKHYNSGAGDCVISNNSILQEYQTLLKDGIFICK